jgi:DASH complex subunit DAM1
MPSKPHPLRRISTNSLTSLARSQQDATSPSQLSFLAPALQDLVDESASLVQNTRALNRVSEALGVFNEGFGAYLYALRMGAFCVDWREGPEGGSWGEFDEQELTSGARRRVREVSVPSAARRKCLPSEARNKPSGARRTLPSKARRKCLPSAARIHSRATLPSAVSIPSGEEGTTDPSSAARLKRLPSEARVYSGATLARAYIRGGRDDRISSAS